MTYDSPFFLMGDSLRGCRASAAVAANSTTISSSSGSLVFGGFQLRLACFAPPPSPHLFLSEKKNVFIRFTTLVTSRICSSGHGGSFPL